MSLLRFLRYFPETPKRSNSPIHSLIVPSSGPLPSTSAKLFGRRLSRIASTMSGARQVSGRSRPSCLARSVIDLARPLSIRRRHRCARTTLLCRPVVPPARSWTGRDSTVIDGTGVARGFTDLIR